MIITIPISVPQETGNPYEHINAQDLNPTQQRSYLDRALDPSQGINLHFDHDEIVKLNEAHLFEDLNEKDVRPGTDGSTSIEPDKIFAIATQARNFFHPKEIDPAKKNELGILLKATDQDGKILVEIKVGAEKFKSAVESKLLKTPEPEDITLQ